jgi:hypothetical protein
VSPVSPHPTEEGGLEYVPEMEAAPVMSATLLSPPAGYEELGSTEHVVSPMTNMPSQGFQDVLVNPEMEGTILPRLGYEVMATPVQRPIEIGHGGPNMTEGRGW